MKDKKYKCPHCKILLASGEECKCGYIARTEGNTVSDRPYDPKDLSWDVGW